MIPFDPCRSHSRLDNSIIFLFCLTELMGIPRVLTIAGSDSGGGAGIQADLKTFASLDVHGLSAVTSITAQNTMDVSKILDLPIGIIKAQITAVAEDIGFDAIKIGMLYKKSIVESIGSLISKFKVPIVVDPVMLSKSGSSLLDTDAVDAMVTSMLPRATVLTPNIHEAEVISNIKIRSIKNVKEAAKVISKLGPEAVVIKGGHLQNNGIAIDTLFWRNRFNFFEAKRIDTKDTHGTGCTFSSAIAANLAKRRDVFDAVKDAKEFVSNAIIHAYRVGGGHGPVNPSGAINRSASSYEILLDLQEGIEIIESGPRVHLLSPECQMNIGVAIPGAMSKDDVMAVPGRIVNLGSKVKASSSPRFGASKHVANTILAAMNMNSSRRAAINIRYSDIIINECKKLKWSVIDYDRTEEPLNVKMKEGATTSWGAKKAIDNAGVVPDVIYHLGELGKEPMILILGITAKEVASKVVSLSERIYS